jgi:hypothetical protein
MNNLILPAEARAFDQLLRRQKNRSDSGSQRVAQWEIDAIAGLVTKLMFLLAEPTGSTTPDRERISIGWDRYQELLCDGERLRQLETWGTRFPVTIKATDTSVMVTVGEISIASPTIQEAIDTHVVATENT